MTMSYNRGFRFWAVLMLIAGGLLPICGPAMASSAAMTGAQIGNRPPAIKTKTAQYRKPRLYAIVIFSPPFSKSAKIY